VQQTKNINIFNALLIIRYFTDCVFVLVHGSFRPVVDSRLTKILIFRILCSGQLTTVSDRN